MAFQEWLYRETLRIGELTRSSTMVANAFHHRTDALSSVIALGGVVGSAYGMPAVDRVAGIAVALMVAKVGVEMGMDSVRELLDTQVGADMLRCVREVAEKDPDVLSATSIRGRKLGPYVALELRLQVTFNISVSAAQQVATKAKLRIFEALPEVADVSITLDAERPLHDGFGTGLVVGWQVNPREGDLMRSPVDIEGDVRAAIVAHGLSGPGCVWGLTHAHIHWETRRNGAIVEANIVADPDIGVRDAYRLSTRVKAAILQAVPDVIAVRWMAGRWASTGTSALPPRTAGPSGGLAHGTL